MELTASTKAANPREGAEAAARRSVRLALILGFSAFAIAGLYYGALYVIAH